MLEISCLHCIYCIVNCAIVLLILLQENGHLCLKNSLLEAEVDNAGRLITLCVSGSQKYKYTYSAADLLLL